MSRATYYSPLGIGFVLGIILVLAQSSQLGIVGSWWLPLVFLSALLVGTIWGLSLQVVMIGIQGVSAQVIPVPFGRSIRNAKAVVIGSFLLIGSACHFITGIWHAVSCEAFDRGLWIIAFLGLASLLVALVLYIWCIPMAERDFES